MKKLVLAGILMLPFMQSCKGFFGPTEAEVTVLAESVAVMRARHLKTLEVFEKIVDQATGITDAQRLEIKTAIATDREQFGKIAGSVMDTIVKLGDLNWKDLTIRLLSESKEVYEEFMKEFGDLIK